MSKPDFSAYEEMYVIYQNLGYIRHYLNVLFTSKDFTVNAKYPEEVLKQLTFGEPESEEADNHCGRPQHYFKSLKTEVETLAKGFPLTFCLNTFPYNDASNDRAVKIIKTLLPDFEVPQNWKLNKSAGAHSVDPIFKKVSRRFSLKDLSRMNFTYTPNDNADSSDRLYLASEEEGGSYHFKDSVDIELVLNNVKANLSSDSVSVDSGSFTGMRCSLVFSVEVNFFVKFPKEYALWSTFCKKEEDFSPTQFLQLVNQNAAYAVIDGAPVPSNRIKSFSSIVKDNDAKIKSGDRTVKPRSNEDGFIMLRSGHIVWIPEENNVSSYDAIIRKSFDSKTGFAKPPQELGVTNKALYTDWINNIFTYVNSSGNIEYQSLIGGIPLSSQTIARILSSEVSYLGKDFFSALGSWYKEPIHFKYRDRDWKYSLIECYDFLEMEKVTWGQLGTKQNLLALPSPSSDSKQLDNFNLPKMEEDEVEEANERIADLVNALQPIFSKAMAEFGSIGCSLQTKMRVLRLGLVLVTKYAPMKKQFLESFRTNKRLNSFKSIGVPEKIDTFNLPGLSSFMPSQAKALSDLNTSGDCGLVDISAGGGKSLVSIASLMQRLKKGTTKRALVIMPDSLIKNYIDEVNNFSKGHINTFPFKTSVTDRLASMGYDAKKIVSMVKSMPLNTIFIAGYNFIKSKRGMDGISKEDLLYGTYKIPVYPNAEILIECEFDTVILDESHKVRNLDSNLTVATSMVVAQAKTKLLMSGTLITNTTSDYVGQMSMIDPTVFGSKDNFKEEYLESAGRGEVESVSTMTSIVNRVQQAILPYAKKITFKRREWAPFLPKIIEYTNMVRMSDVQQSFYEDLMNKALEEIRGNPKYAKLFRTSRPEDEEKIEAALKRYLAGVEIFINAPESNFAFATQHSGSPDELVSPKVHKINEILDAHFNGGRVDGHDIKKSDGKVLIFSYNKAVSPHIFKYLKYRNKAIHIRTGDEDALVKFKEDPNIMIAVADEDGLKEGVSLTACTSLIRVQTLWNPGDQEQALSRILRPDPTDKYGRTEVRFFWVATEKSIEIAKMARMFSKVITKARNDEYGQPGWSDIDKQLEELPLIKMNLDFIQQFKFDSDLDEYWNAYATFRSWEFGQFDAVLNHYKSLYMEKHGKLPSRVELMNYIMVKSENADLPNSKRAYTPFVEGMVAPVDSHGLDLQPIVLAETTLEDEESDEEESVKIENGDCVWTEFGPGQVMGKPRKKQIKVFVHGVGETLLPKSSVFVAGDFGQGGTKQKKLESLFKVNKNGALTLKPGSSAPIKQEVNLTNIKHVKLDKPVVKEEPEDENTNEENKESQLRRGSDNDFNVSVSNVNNQIALFTTANKDVTKIVGSGWKYNDKFLYTMVKNRKGFDNLMAAFERKKLSISPAYLEKLEEVRPLIIMGEKKFMQNKPLKIGEIKNFFRINPRPIGTDIRPYPLFFNNILHIAVNAKTHSKFLSKLKSIVVAGCTPWKLNPPIVIKFFPTKQAAMTELVRINKKMPITNFDSAVNELKTMVYRASKKK